MRPVVATTGGALRGRRAAGGYVFRGVRYGEPTSGAGRFRPPVPARPRQGVLDADAPGPACPPTLTADDRVAIDRSPWWWAYGPFDDSVTYAEDCLRLNIWTPQLAAGRRPVLVWLHGGGFSWGSGAGPLTEGDALALRQDVVVVSVNHRLGVLGYLYLAGVAEGWEGSGVAGMLDLCLALRWVQDNIAAFGGDPGNVTLVGHSGGGAKVACLLAMPTARGLFHRAVIQSGVVSLRQVTADEATATAGRLLAAAGLSPARARALQRLPVPVLTRVASGLRFRPVVGEELLPAHPFDPVAAPTAGELPLLIGTTAHDTAAFKSFDAHPSLSTLDHAELEQLVATHPAAALREAPLGEAAPVVVAAFADRYPQASRAELLVLITTALLRYRTWQLVRRKLAAGPAPAYVYEFDYRAPMPVGTAFPGRLMAPHGLEIPFVFDIVDRVPLTGDDPRRREVARQLSHAWAEFARSGVPRLPDGGPAWPAYRFPERPTLVFDRTPRLVGQPHADQAALFDRIAGGARGHW